ncbi:secreted RxLR effector protein 161-like [Cryptomeria japonica]|uniref:secreted RxLR effector protein 161-like n=1 Tax=Cryptomeria japonica TaxID=3369 RepID=UPI0027DA5674|nr:secreted RxLR effector protein 161-like [Cryptomeria japonica]
MEGSNLVSTPMVTGYKLSVNDESPNVNQTYYMSMVGNLLYVTATRPDIMQAVGYVVRFQAFLKETHVQAVKRIFKYHKGTMSFGLWYPRCQYFTLTTYTSVDWGGSLDDRKRTSGGALFVGGCLVSWLNKKQASISLSTTKAEYIAVVSCCI